MAFSKHMRLTLLAALLALKATTGSSSSSFNITYKREGLDDSSDSSSENVNLSEKDFIHRSLMMKMAHEVPHAPALVHPPHEPIKPVHPTDRDGPEVHPVNGVAGGAAMAHTKEEEEMKKHHALCRNPQNKNDPKCKVSHHVIFVQEWVPSLKFKNPQNLCWQCSPAVQLEEFNKLLTISDYIPVGSNLASKTKTGSKNLPDKDFYVIDQNLWWDQRRNNFVYQQMWDKYGIHTGLTPQQFFMEVQRLHKNHPGPYPKVVDKKNPKAATGKLKEDTMSLSQLRNKVGKNSCVVCKKNNKGVEYFDEVRHCHAVINNHADAKPVQYKACGNCPATCTGNILIPQFEIY